MQRGLLISCCGSDWVPAIFSLAYTSFARISAIVLDTAEVENELSQLIGKDKAAKSKAGRWRERAEEAATPPLLALV